MNANRLPLFSPMSDSNADTQSSRRKMSRRHFLRASVLTGASAPWVLTAAAASGPRVIGANEKLNHACIGVGGMGWGDLQSFAKHKRLEVVAMCDVDENTLKNATKVAPGARLYRDWRELLDKEGDKIDSVNVTVPDHMHFAIAFSAIQNGKHVYCQKPLCHDISEVRTLTQAAAKLGVITQLGTQMASGIHDRTAVQWLREGRIGKITHAYLCSNRPGAVESYRLLGPRPATGQEPPKYLDWNLWIG